MQKNFFLGLGAILIVYILAGSGISKAASFNPDQILSLCISGIIATVNIVIAFLVVKLSMHKEQDVFTKIFLSGMVIRLLGLLAVIFLVLKYSRVDHFVFIGSLFILYFIYQVWEVLMLNSKNKQG